MRLEVALRRMQRGGERLAAIDAVVRDLDRRVPTESELRTSGFYARVSDALDKKDSGGEPSPEKSTGGKTASKVAQPKKPPVAPLSGQIPSWPDV